MDSKEAKLEKKLARVAKQIKKSRGDKEAARKEEKQFNEIKQLLEVSDDEEKYVPDEKENDFEKIDVLPLEAPCIEVFDINKLFWNFDEETLKCDSFLNPGEKSYIFGKEINQISEDKIRNLIRHGLAENIQPGKDTCKSISTYVFYLLSVHSDLKFVLACFEFLEYRCFSVSPDVILTVLANYGSSVRGLCDSTFETDFPFQCVKTKSSKKCRFPFSNMSMVAQLLLLYAKNNQIVFDWHTKHLIRALAKITLDPYVRSSGLFPIFSRLLSFLAAKAVEIYGSYEVATWLRLEGVTPHEQIEVCKSLKPVAQDLRHELVLGHIDDLLKPRNSYVAADVKIKDIKRILEELKKKPFDITQYYCICQLILILLPFVDSTVKESQELNLLLGSLERKIANNKDKDSTDILRIKLDFAKIQNLVTSKSDNRQAVNEGIEVSPVKLSFRRK